MMHGESISAATLSSVIRDLEEAVERANLLALEVALRAIDQAPADADIDAVAGVGQMADRAARATEEMVRLVRRVKAA